MVKRICFYSFLIQIRVQIIHSLNPKCLQVSEVLPAMEAAAPLLPWTCPRQGPPPPPTTVSHPPWPPRSPPPWHPRWPPPTTPPPAMPHQSHNHTLVSGGKEQLIFSNNLFIHSLGTSNKYWFTHSFTQSQKSFNISAVSLFIFLFDL